LHVVSWMNPSEGGPPRVAARLAAGHANAGCEVTLACYPLEEERDALREMVARMPGFARVNVVELPSPRSQLERTLGLETRRVLRGLVERVDVVHLHNVWETSLRIAASHARSMGKPYFVEPNDMLTPYALSQKRVKKSVALALAYRRMINGAAGLIFGHEEERRLASQAGFASRPLVANLGGVFEAEVEPLPQPGAFFKRYPQLDGRPFLLFLGRFHHKKGVDLLAEAFAIVAKQHADAQLVMVGRDDGAEADFRERVARHGLGDRVHMVGQLHGESKWEAYRDATHFILPSRDEAFTVAITEALASGCPVVISNACHNDEIGTEGAGLISSLEPADIAAASLRLFNDGALQQRLAAGAREFFRRHLSFDVAAADTLRFYREAMAAK
jgi:glycosyltransferase involved in cell wall biosynthesis